MGSTADNGASSIEKRHLHRRAFATGLIGGGLLAGGLLSPTRARADLPHQGPPLVLNPDPDALRLLSNLMTRMATPTAVNGTDAYRFVLDTGAERTAIADDVARALALPPGPPVMVHGVTAAEQVDTVRIDHLAFGGGQFRNIIAPVFPRALLSADGLLGLDVLARFELAFNLADSTARLSLSDPPGVALRQSSGGANRMRRSDGARPDLAGQILMLNVLAEGRPVVAFIDSGAQYSIGNMALLQAVGSAATVRLERPPQVPVYGVTGQMLLAESGMLQELEIDRKRLGPTPMLFADLHAFRKLGLIDRPALLIGADVLYRFRGVSLDFARARVNFRGLRARPTLTTG